MDSLIENLGPFATVRNQSRWLMPTFSTMVAGMMWSRVTALNGPDSIHWSNGFGVLHASGQWSQIHNPSMLYSSKAEITRTRPALRKSAWLFCVFAIQPLLTVAILLGRIVLYSIPIGQGFGLIAILAGIDRNSLDALDGASFSGKLDEPTSLGISVEEFGDRTGKVQYRAGERVPSTTGTAKPASSDKLNWKWQYR